jgi:hypothetical protein
VRNSFLAQKAQKEKLQVKATNKVIVEALKYIILLKAILF